MTASRWPFLLAVGLVLVGAAGILPAETLAGSSPATEEGILAATADGVEPDEVVIEVALEPDGSARWTIKHRVRLDDPAVTRGFERTQTRLRDNRSAFREPFARRVRAMATEAEDATDRVMVVENVSVESYRTQITQEYGVVEYRFRWYGFAATDEKLRAGDALSGLFLDEKTSLLMTWPRNATLAEVTPEPDERRDRAVVWRGPIDFVQGEPRVVVESESTSFGPDLSFTAGSNDILVTLLALSLVVGTVVGGVFAWRRRGETEAKPETATADDPTAEGTAAAGSTDQETGEKETEAKPETAEEAEEGEETPPEELLSNEEQVLALLDERGGRMKQQEVVTELDWSETKTSEVVSELREAEEIEVYRLGRENVLALPETGLGLDSDSGGDEE